MNEQKPIATNFQLNWSETIFCDVFAGITMIVCWWLLFDSKPIRLDLFLIFAALSIGCINLFIKTYFDWYTRFNQCEITRPGLFGTKVIRWCEVEQVRLSRSIHIISAKQKIVIRPQVYKEPQKVVEFMRDRIIAPAFDPNIIKKMLDN